MERQEVIDELVFNGFRVKYQKDHQIPLRDASSQVTPFTVSVIVLGGDYDAGEAVVFFNDEVYYLSHDMTETIYMWKAKSLEDAKNQIWDRSVELDPNQVLSVLPEEVLEEVNLWVG